MNKAVRDGATPMHAAAEKGHGKVVESLLEAGCDRDKASKNGVTPLYIAAVQGHGKVVESLVKGGCDVDTDDGATPMCVVAVVVGHGEVARLRGR